MVEYDVLVVGAGLSGAVCAERFASVLGKRVLVVDKRDHVAGNCYDYVDDATGLVVSKYGPHFFHCNDPEVWEYVRRFAEFIRYDHRGVARVDGKVVPLPVNINTLNALFDADLSSADEMRDFLDGRVTKYGRRPRNGEESCLARFGRDVYEAIFRPYTTKQWARDPAQLDASVLDRIPLRFDFDDRYFADKFQGMPRNGYTDLVRNMLTSPLIEVRLGVDYFSPDFTDSAPITIFTGPVDQYFSGAGLEPLQYRSLRFEVERHLEQPGFAQTHTVVNYPAASYGFTRITEYKHVFGNAQRAPNCSVTVKEYPSDEGPEYYPVVNERNLQLYARYQQLAEAEEAVKGVYFLGRLATFKYINMDTAIANALSFFRDKFLTARPQATPPPS